MPWLWIALAVLLLGLFLAAMYHVGRRASSPAEARRRFDARREQLQQAFFRAAAASGKPRGLRWKSIDWQPGVELVRERGSRQLAALVGVTVAFEAVAGSDMEGLPAVGNLRHGSAVFFYHNTFDSPYGSACKNILKGFAKYGSGNAQLNVTARNNIFHYWGRLYETGGKSVTRNSNDRQPTSCRTLHRR